MLQNTSSYNNRFCTDKEGKTTRNLEMFAEGLTVLRVHLASVLHNLKSRTDSQLSVSVKNYAQGISLKGELTKKKESLVYYLMTYAMGASLMDYRKSLSAANANTVDVVDKLISNIRSLLLSKSKIPDQSTLVSIINGIKQFAGVEPEGDIEQRMLCLSVISTFVEMMPKSKEVPKVAMVVLKSELKALINQPKQLHDLLDSSLTQSRNKLKHQKKLVTRLQPMARLFLHRKEQKRQALIEQARLDGEASLAAFTLDIEQGKEEVKKWSRILKSAGNLEGKYQFIVSTHLKTGGNSEGLRSGDLPRMAQLLDMKQSLKSCVAEGDTLNSIFQLMTLFIKESECKTYFDLSVEQYRQLKAQQTPEALLLLSHARKGNTALWRDRLEQLKRDCSVDIKLADVMDEKFNYEFMGPISKAQQVGRKVGRTLLSWGVSFMEKLPINLSPVISAVKPKEVAFNFNVLLNAVSADNARHMHDVAQRYVQPLESAGKLYDNILNAFSQLDSKPISAYSHKVIDLKVKLASAPGDLSSANDDLKREVEALQQTVDEYALKASSNIALLRTIQVNLVKLNQLPLNIAPIQKKFDEKVKIIFEGLTELDGVSDEVKSTVKNAKDQGIEAQLAKMEECAKSVTDGMKHYQTVRKAFFDGLPAIATKREFVFQLEKRYQDLKRQWSGFFGFFIKLFAPIALKEEANQLGRIFNSTLCLKQQYEALKRIYPVGLANIVHTPPSVEPTEPMNTSDSRVSNPLNA